MINSDWKKKYNLAKKYYEEHGNLLIPSNYEIEYKNKKINLGNWICKQRIYFYEQNIFKLDEEKIKLLEQVGMIWNVTQYIWIDKLLERQYRLYEKRLIDENLITLLLEIGFLSYSDSGEIQKQNALEFCQKNYWNK